jgi:glycerophosphoryl diester phosphodiesterase
VHPDWLTRCPVAHRGLHDGNQQIMENSLSAFEAAASAGLAVECDVQLSRDGVVMVFHDTGLERLTSQTGLVAQTNCQDLQAMALGGTGDTIPSLKQLLSLIGGRVPVFIEMKSEWDKSPLIAQHIASNIEGYKGDAALMSFDPHLVSQAKKHAPQRPVGLVADRFQANAWPHLNKGQRFYLRWLIAAFLQSPDFLAYDAKALPSLWPATVKRLLNMPCLSWTVRSQAQAESLRPYVDQIIFEGFMPDCNHKQLLKASFAKG